MSASNGLPPAQSKESMFVKVSDLVEYYQTGQKSGPENEQNKVLQCSPSKGSLDFLYLGALGVC